MENIVVSIIIVNYNTREFTRRCLQSLKKAQIAVPYEIKALQKIWKYRQPEIEGFMME